MVKLKRPKKLIGFYSDESLKTGKPFKYSGRQKAYMVVLALLLGFVTYISVSRTDLESVILRNPGATFTILEDNVQNIYKIQMINKSNGPLEFVITSDFPNADLKFIGSENDYLTVKEGEMFNGIMLVTIPAKELNGMKNFINFEVNTKEGEFLDDNETTFLGPKK